MITFTTYSGSTYEVEDDLSAVRRVDFTHSMRRDGEWVKITAVIVPIEVGNAALFEVEPLGDLPLTYRRTSEILTVSHTEN